MAPATHLRFAALWEVSTNGNRSIADVRRALLETIRFTDSEMRATPDPNSDYFLLLSAEQEECTETLVRLRKRNMTQEELQKCCATISGFAKDILIAAGRPDLARMVAT